MSAMANRSDAESDESQEEYSGERICPYELGVVCCHYVGVV